MPAWLLALDRHFPIRYLTLLAAAIAALLGGFVWVAFGHAAWLALLGVAGVIVGIHDLRQARHAVNTARHATEDAMGEAAQNIRRHPFRAVGAAAVVGVVAGALVGFGVGRFARTRC